MATALLVVLTHPVEGKEEEYNRWYSEDHLDDVLTAAGFEAARRFRFIPSKLSRRPAEPYLAIYEVDADRREEAEALLLKTAGTDAMPISDTLAQPAVTWWFESITDRVEAASAASHR
ncbi:MAG TPA: hypothetical protein VHX88_00445 [Solirubrobacteraceae bacterium]|jgi:hypothetical protein|nr:hypothetical protein [Solirubrobacteraceae bacterium]